MVKIRVDGKEFETGTERNLLQTCLALGFNIPYFCYHPALGSVGACRQCAVKKFSGPDDKRGRIIMSCMEPVTEGLIITTNDEEVRAFRRAVIESLMTNHPHDCPVCDEGGECHLQDMTVMTGHNYRRFNFKKRTHFNQYLGPYIHHEMNRCIQCYRCVRFYRDYAGGKDLHVFGSGGRVWFGRHEPGKLESEFSGNLVEVCPTGVFTDKTLNLHYTRKWDLTNAPSICHNCSVGCNIIVSERYGKVRRIMSRYNADVNGYFICDRGRFSYDFINSPERITELSSADGYAEPGTETGEGISAKLGEIIKAGKIVGIGSPEASLESNFALQKLVGKDNFYHGVNDTEYHLVKEVLSVVSSSPALCPSLHDIESADAVLILGEDPMNSAPMMALAIRQASRNKGFEIAAKAGVASWHDAAVRDLTQQIKSPVFILSNSETGIDDLAERKYVASPETLAKLGFSISSAIGRPGREKIQAEKDLSELVEAISIALSEAVNPLIVTGIQSSSTAMLHAAADIAIALASAGRKPMLSVILPSGNSAGLGMLEGKPLGDLQKEKGIDTMIVLENDLYRIIPEENADSLMDKARNLILLHHSRNRTAARASFLVPAGTFAESTGTIVNYEGRVQRFYRVLPEGKAVKDSWKHLSDFIGYRDGFAPWENHDDILRQLEEEYPVFAAIDAIIPGAGLRYMNEKITRQTPRFSGRTAMNANINVSEPAPPQDPDSALAFSMEGYKGIPDSHMVPYYWSPGWNSPQAINKYLDEPGGRHKGGREDFLIFSRKDTIRTEYYGSGDKKVNK